MGAIDCFRPRWPSGKSGPPGARWEGCPLAPVDQLRHTHTDTCRGPGPLASHLHTLSLPPTIALLADNLCVVSGLSILRPCIESQLLAPAILPLAEHIVKYAERVRAGPPVTGDWPKSGRSVGSSVVGIPPAAYRAMPTPARTVRATRTVRIGPLRSLSRLRELVAEFTSMDSGPAPRHTHSEALLPSGAYPLKYFLP